MPDCAGRGKYRLMYVDDKEASSFLFPSLIKRGELSVGISTGGSSPSGGHLSEGAVRRGGSEKSAGDSGFPGRGSGPISGRQCPGGGAAGSADEGTVLGLYGAGRAADPRRRSEGEWKSTGRTKREDGKRGKGHGLFGGSGLRACGPHHGAGACGF